MPNSNVVETTVQSFIKSKKLCILKGNKKDDSNFERIGFINELKSTKKGKVVVFLDVLRKGPRTFILNNIGSVSIY